MRIEKIDKDNIFHSKLQEFILDHGLFFNSPAWLSNYPANNIQQCAIINDNNEITGCYLYYVFTKAVFTFIITPPFTPHIGLFYINPAESVVGKNSYNKDLFTLIADYFESCKAQQVTINFPYEILDTQPFIWKGYTSRIRYSYLIDLSADEETIKNNLSASKRRSIAKAIKDELVIRECTDMNLVIELILQSLGRNSKSKNLNILKNILFSYAKPGNYISYVAYRDNKPISATFCVLDKSSAIYLFGGIDSDSRHHGAGVSCMWQSILKARSLGLHYFDFEGSMNKSIERYFREFGGQLVPYYNVEKTIPLLKVMLALRKHDNN